MRNLLLKYENWLKEETEHHMYRYTPDLYRYMLAQNDKNLTCSSTCSRCTGTCHQKIPKMCFFLPFFHIFLPNSTLYFIHTSKPLQFILKSLFLFKLSFITYHYSKIFHEFPPNNSNMGHNPYTNKTQGFVKVILTLAQLLVI